MVYTTFYISMSTTLPSFNRTTSIVPPYRTNIPSHQHTAPPYRTTAPPYRTTVPYHIPSYQHTAPLYRTTVPYHHIIVPTHCTTVTVPPHHRTVPPYRTIYHRTNTPYVPNIAYTAWKSFTPTLAIHKVFWFWYILQRKYGQMIFIRINESWKKLWGNDWNIWVVSESTEEFPWIVEYRGWCHAAHAAHAAPVPWILQKSKSARYQRSSAVTWRSATLLWDHIWEPAKCKEVIGLAQFLGYDISMDILWYHLVGGIPTPLKNMSSSVGMIFSQLNGKS